MEDQNNQGQNPNGNQPAAQVNIQAAPGNGIVAKVRGEGLKRFGMATLNVTGALAKAAAMAAISGFVTGLVLKSTLGTSVKETTIEQM